MHLGGLKAELGSLKLVLGGPSMHQKGLTLVF
jgi:hypothetical protein